MRSSRFFRCIPPSVAVATILFGSSGVAFAATYGCDNDRVASQYPHCATHAFGAWIYYSGQAHDDNRDDRRARSTTSARPGYAWTFDRKGTYSADVYLSNSAFTTSNALYRIFDYRSKKTGTGRSFNQNVARSGWTNNVLASASIGDSVLVNTGTNGITGADAVRVHPLIVPGMATDAKLEGRSGGDAERSSASCGLTGRILPDVAFLQAKMLDATDRYGDASGQYRIWFTNNGQDDTVDFEVSPRDHSSFVRIAPRGGAVEEHAASRGASLTLKPDTREYARGAFNDAAPLSSVAATPRSFFNQRCEPVYVLRDDPTGAVGASDALLPQQFAFWLDGGSRIVGSARMLGRSATVVEGRHDADMATKLGAATYRMWVDSDTGVLLKVRGDDADGRQVYGLDMRQIAFNSGRRLDPDMRVVNGWKEIPQAASAVALPAP